ncbi:oligosaccharide flippase family protein [Vibrio splendidus]|uniref:oligosaccharide flippase family protein n=1 Tax=Vibrio splendidus TaxID=29497 RepID=UPI0007F94B36|nr:oligosaccharide flippase family protein [Vibrio splendidus]OBT24230.1 polysaccharide biosynthesis protein [Vibrio splendidus]
MSTLKNTSVYLISNIVNAAVPFLLLPILTRELTPVDYGKVALFQMLITGMTALIGFNVVGAASRKYYDDNMDEGLLKKFNGACLHILMSSSLIISIILLIFKIDISNYLEIDSDWIVLSILICLSNFISNLRLGQWQVRKKAVSYGVFQVGKTVVNISFSLLLVVTFSFGGEGRVLAIFISSALYCIIALYYLYRDDLVDFFSWELVFLKEALYFGTPLIPHTIGLFLIGSIDRYIISQEMGFFDAGIYMVAFQISTAIAILFDAINKAFVPWLFSKLKENSLEENQNIVKKTYLYFMFLSMLAVVSYILSPFIILFVIGSEYKDAQSVIGILCIGQIFGGMYLMVTNYIFYSKKTAGLSAITITCGVANVVIMTIMVGKYGLQGAAYAFAFTKLLQFAFTWIYSSHVLPMPWFRVLIDIIKRKELS